MSFINTIMSSTHTAIESSVYLKYVFYTLIGITIKPVNDNQFLASTTQPVSWDAVTTATKQAVENTGQFIHSIDGKIYIFDLGLADLAQILVLVLTGFFTTVTGMSSIYKAWKKSRRRNYTRRKKK